MTRWFVLLRFGSCKPTPRWDGHKDRVSFNPFPLSHGHLDRVSFSSQSNGTLSPHKDHHTIGVSCLDYNRVGNKKKEEEKQSKRKSSNNIKCLSLVTNFFGVIPDLGEDLISLVVSLNEVYSSCMTFDGWKLGCIEVWVVGGIYSPNHQIDRWWRLLSYGAPDSPVRHRTLSGAPATSPGRWFRPLELLTVGPPDSPVVHRTGHVHCPVRLWRLLWLLRAQWTLFTVPVPLQTTVGAWSCCSACSTGQSGATPDSPVNYSGAASRIPESGIRVELPSAPDTVRWHTGQSGAPDQGCLWVVFCSLYLNSFLVFLLVCCEPLAPVKLMI
jgi:hypothetical protein